MNLTVHQEIANVGLFASLSADCVLQMQRVSIRRSFVDGQTIHMQGDDAHLLNVVLLGHVRLFCVMENGSAVPHDIVPQRAVFGELSVIDRSSYPDIAIAVGRVSLLSLPSAALIDLARAHASLAQSLRCAVAQRYGAYFTLVRDLSLHSLPARLARTLIRLADRLEMQIEHGGRLVQAVSDIVTQTDLGLMARGSRGNVNRALQTWQRTGWIVLRDRNILILNRDALSRLAVKDQD